MTDDALYRRRVELADQLEWRLQTRAGETWAEARVAYLYGKDQVEDPIAWKGEGYYLYYPDDGRWGYLHRFFPKADARAWQLVREANAPERKERAREGLGVFLEILGAIVPWVVDAIREGRKK